MCREWSQVMEALSGETSEEGETIWEEDSEGIWEEGTWETMQEEVTWDRAWRITTWEEDT